MENALILALLKIWLPLLKNKYFTNNHSSFKHVLIFGDSNACRPAGSKYNWPSMLQRMSGNAIQVINESYDGRTIQFDSGELNGLRIIKEKIKGFSSIDICLIALGTNDLKKKYGPPGLAEIIEGLAKIVSIIKRMSSKIRIFLLTPPCFGGVNDADFADSQSLILPLTSEYISFAASQNISIINLSNIIHPGTDLKKDGVHLSLKGRIKVAEVAWKEIKKCC